jgi:two-component system, NarL family, response regulator NreC
MTIRVLLADDHEIVRAGLRLLINGQPDMDVVAEAATGEQAIERVHAVRPDVAVLDLTMPGLSGLDTARRLLEVRAPTRIVVLTRHDDDAYVRELLAAGASGYVLKHSASTELLKAIRAVARGDSYLDPALNRSEPLRTWARGPRPTVTNREREVLRLTALGHSNKEIASQLGLSAKTVEVHKANAMRKLHLGGRADVVRYAVLNGWLRDV